ncbi:hypothetical protein Raf01_06850 [Rugosimonospora africana]|uniref:Uncharacterized protein n=1 Tax=Rugosimonospora africana TaxID=556532 RepID=A0A8J3QK85_9ACTN|nr:hypothetical protein [Rugosimonospora africana]GIH12513.1 hypothetical protein Raf01_06850 [Rugosimonospora africana]
MDETGQPGSEPAGANGDGAREHGMTRIWTNGWQAEAAGSRGDAVRAEAVRSGATRPVLRSVDGGRSGTAAVVEPDAASAPSWHRSVATEVRDWPDSQSRPAEMPAQRFPGNVQQPIQGPWAPRQPVEPRAPQAVEPAAPARAEAPYDPYQSPRLTPPSFDDMPALGRMSAANPAVQASHASSEPDDAGRDCDERSGTGGHASWHPGGHGAGADPERAASERAGMERGGQSNSFRGSHSGPAEAVRRAEALRPADLIRQAERWPAEHHPAEPHPADQWQAGGRAAEQWPANGTSENRHVEAGSAEARQAESRAADQWAPEPRPADERSGEHRPVDPPSQAGPARQSPPYLDRPNLDRLDVDRPADGYGPPMAPRDQARRAASMPAIGRIDQVGPAAPHREAPAAPTLEPPRLHGPSLNSAPDDPAVVAEAARQAIPLRDSFAALRAGAAAGHAEAEAGDHAAVQAAYAAAVESARSDADQSDDRIPGISPRDSAGGPELAASEPFGPQPFAAQSHVPQSHGPQSHATEPHGTESSHRTESFDPQPLGPPTPLGQPSLADYSDNPGVVRQPGAGEPAGPAAEAQPASDPSALAGSTSAFPIPRVLPQRVPAAPDVPDVPDDGSDDEFIEQGRPSFLDPPELARIATHLRYDENLEEAPPRPDGFDTDAILAAVRNVPGVRDAQLKPNPGGVHTLRLDLADGADGAQVSRDVARLLKQRMGLAAEPRRQGEPRRQAEARRQQAPAAPPANASQPRAETGSVPVTGVAPASRAPLSAAATEQLSGPAARNDERNRRRHQVAPGRARTAAEPDPEPRRVVRSVTGPRVIIDQVQVSTLGLDATVEVRLTSAGRPAIGVASGPAVDGYVLRLAAVAATAALDQLLSGIEGAEQPGRCFVEHAAVVPFGGSDVAVVVVLLVLGGTAEQLSGSALVAGDPRQAIVRATLAAVNRRLDALLG